MAKKEKPRKTILSPAGNRKEQLKLTLVAIDKEFGKDSVRVGLGGNAVPGVEFFSSQSIGVDFALGGGWAKGRLVEVYGPESSGKTTLCLHAAAEIQKTGGTAAFIDAEHALDINYAHDLGVNIDTLLISQPDSGEQALEITEMLVRSGAVDVIIIDSVAALVPQKEIEGQMGDAQMGAQARLLSQAMRKLAGIVSKAKCTIIFINQIRMKIGVMFGNPETTTGGNALKFYTSQRVDIRRIGGIKGPNGEYIGNQTRVKVVKNKVAPPFKEHEFQIIYGKGINIFEDLLTVAADMGIVEKNGSWYSYGSDRIGQGATQASLFLENNPKLAKSILDKVTNG